MTFEASLRLLLKLHPTHLPAVCEPQEASSPLDSASILAFWKLW
jgi:hypothetical protein